MRVLVLNYEYPPIGGGASPVTRAVARELAALGDRVDVVTMAYRDLPRVEEADGVRVHRVPCLRASPHICRAHELATWLPAARRTAGALLRAERFDLVHAHFFLPSGLVARSLRRATGVPYVVTAHGSDVPGYNPDRFRGLHRLAGPVWRRVVADARALTSPSESLAALIRRAAGRDVDIAIIPNGIRENWIEPAGAEPAAKRERILLVSRLFERKGAQYLIEALRGLGSTWEVHVVGEGPYRPALERLAATVPHAVTFHGWLDNGSPELADLYRTAAIFVFPSVAENFPISLLEAMISGAAIVATDLPACFEVLGDTALTFAPGDVGGLRAHLRALTGDPVRRAELGRRARRRVLERFTWPRVGRQYRDLFASLVGGG